ncbi:MAG: right-handed parallel beta-helix repeat-containing protein [Lentisphaeria bacterium]|nr:right-handed parallel beta-helix repeat-containing protein [Lentisphaeria bacterium]
MKRYNAAIRIEAILVMASLALSVLGTSAAEVDIEVPVGGDIQAAIDTAASVDGGGTVILKKGTHTIDVPLKLWSNVTVRGEGSLESSLKTAKNIKMITASTNGLSNLVIRNLVIIGTNAEKGGGIHLVSYEKDHENITISNVHVFNTGWGVHIKGAKNLVIENCNFSRNGTKGEEGYAHNLYLRRCYTVKVSNCIFNDCISANGVNISYSRDIGVVNCRMIGNHFRGIRAADSDGFKVHNCVIAKNGTVGLLANTEKAVTKNIDWRNNQVFENGAEGIYTRDGATGVCENNNAFGNKKGDYRLSKQVSNSGNTSDPKADPSQNDSHAPFYPRSPSGS